MLDNSQPLENGLQNALEGGCTEGGFTEATDLRAPFGWQSTPELQLYLKNLINGRQKYIKIFTSGMLLTQCTTLQCENKISNPRLNLCDHHIKQSNKRTPVGRGRKKMGNSVDFNQIDLSHYIKCVPITISNVVNDNTVSDNAYILGENGFLYDRKDLTIGGRINDLDLLCNLVEIKHLSNHQVEWI